MATQRCPKCGSNRIRPGYRSTSFFSKLIFRYNLLCNTCNLAFVGFAIPGTVSNKSKKIKKFHDPNYRPPETLKTAKAETKENIRPEHKSAHLEFENRPFDFETEQIENKTEQFEFENGHLEFETELEQIEFANAQFEPETEPEQIEFENGHFEPETEKPESFLTTEQTQSSVEEGEDKVENWEDQTQAAGSNVIRVQKKPKKVRMKKRVKVKM